MRDSQEALVGAATSFASVVLAIAVLTLWTGLVLSRLSSRVTQFRLSEWCY